MEVINELLALKDKEFVTIEDIPSVFKNDLITFIKGHTLTMQNGVLRIGKNLFNRYIHKIKLKGLDE